jgi:hypothetical protein
MDREADSEAPRKGHPKMFPPVPVDETLTPWQRFERIASKAFGTPKELADTHEPLRPRKTKRA